jgi:formylglycine-generating enzyme required for sulfatase activity
VWTCTVTATDGQGGTTTASAARAIVRRTPIRTVRLPPGTFWMGAPEDEPGRAPQDQLPQRVELTRPFELAMTELTHEEYRAITGKAAPSDVDGTCPACPAQGLSWIEFANFTNELSTLAELPPCYTCDAFACTTVAATGYECEGYRMPASAEWEYAARSLGTVVAAYPNGQDLADFDPDSQNCYDERLTDGSRLGEQAWFCGSALPPPQPVAGLLPNPVGLFDMSGNGGEWLGDAANLGGVSGVDPWKAHRSALGIQSTWYAGGGGSAGANNVRIASRNYWYHTDIANNVGLRIARTLPPGTATLPPPAGAQP